MAHQASKAHGMPHLILFHTDCGNDMLCIPPTSCAAAAFCVQFKIACLQAITLQECRCISLASASPLRITDTEAQVTGPAVSTRLLQFEAALSWSSNANGHSLCLLDLSDVNPCLVTQAQCHASGSLHQLEAASLRRSQQQHRHGMGQRCCIGYRLSKCCFATTTYPCVLSHLVPP